MKIKIFTDGGSRNNPGHAAYGYVIYDENMHIIAEEGKYIGIQTNNVAEYTGVLEALRKALEISQAQKIDAVDCYMDSNLIVQQMMGKFKIKAVHLIPIITEIKSLITQLPPITFNHVPRAQNAKADSLVNIALDQQLFH